MFEPILEQALIRIDGKLNCIPDGFETPVKSKPTLYIHEIEFFPCDFNEGIDMVLRDLYKLKKILLNFKNAINCTSVLHLQVSGNSDHEYLAVKISNSALCTITKMGLNLEIVDCR